MPGNDKCYALHCSLEALLLNRDNSIKDYKSSSTSNRDRNPIGTAKMVQGSTKKSKSAGRVGAAQKSKNAAKYRKAAVNESRAKVGSATKMPKRGNFKDEAITDKALSKVLYK